MTWRDRIEADMESVQHVLEGNGIDLNQASLAQPGYDECNYLLQEYMAFWLHANEALAAADRGDLEAALENLDVARDALWRVQERDTMKLGQENQRRLANGEAQRDRKQPEALGMWTRLQASRATGQSLPREVWVYLDEVAFFLTAMRDPEHHPEIKQGDKRILQTLQFTGGVFRLAAADIVDLFRNAAWYAVVHKNPTLGIGDKRRMYDLVAAELNQWNEQNFETLEKMRSEGHDVALPKKPPKVTWTQVRRWSLINERPMPAEFNNDNFGIQFVKRRWS